jgi:hypothetical protein
MGRTVQYVTLDRILSKIYRDLGIEEISETDVIEWSGEALEAIGAISLYEEAVAFVEVNNYQADLPNGLHAIIQIARNNHWTKENKECCTIQAIAEAEEESTSPSACTTCGGFTDQLVPVDCNGHLIGDVEIAYYRPYFDLKWEYSGWMNSNYNKEHYTPVRLSNHSFFSTLVCHEDEGLYHSCRDEYTIAGDKLRFSFKEGSVAIAYYRQVTDPETGYPMVPDDYSVTTAITMYITMKYMGRMWYTGREGYADKYQKAEQDWHWYCRQAGNAAIAPYGADEFESMLESRINLIPNVNKYYNYFGKTGNTNRLRGLT